MISLTKWKLVAAFTLMMDGAKICSKVKGETFRSMAVGVDKLE